VTDNAGNIQMDTVKVIVNYRTGVLKADAGRDTTLVLPQNYMPLDGSNSTAPAGTNIGCAWKRISGPGASSAVMYPSSNLVTTAGRPAPGTYVYRLIVRDDKGNNDVDYITITVKEKTEVSARTAAPNRQNAIVAAPNVKSNYLQLSVKPNPVTSVMQVQIKGASGNGVLKVYDLQGRLIQYKAFSKQSAATSTINMEVARLHQGAYILQIVVNGNLRKAARFIKL
ncbi:MAG: PKD domain-containing protein, partial [Agriterribacter sp.]